MYNFQLNTTTITVQKFTKETRMPMQL
uniref:Uncharacterized protein n=1 Tax=Rhizophora mucronata TaxID=61149 RepID=A0A2P2PPP3_RHIMU